MFWMLMGSIAASLCGLAVYLYYFQKGQFIDDENIKFQIFREDHPDLNDGTKNDSVRR